MLTMGVHPSSRGFGWVIYEGPFSPYDWGLVKPAHDKHTACVRKLERLLDKYQPDALVLECWDRHRAVRSTRIGRMCRAFASLAATRGIELAVYSRTQVQTSFASVGANTRYEIAEAVARQAECLRHRLPPKRRAWDSEDPRMALFSAAAVVLTHYHLGASGLFEDLIKDLGGK